MLSASFIQHFHSFDINIGNKMHNLIKNWVQLYVYLKLLACFSLLKLAINSKLKNHDSLGTN
jgi:hypothetical protein